MCLTRLEQPEDISAAIREMYGQDLPEPAGCLHSAAVWQQDRDHLITLKILDQTPRSRRDRFTLHLARARSDAIITTGKILRSEPDLTHSLPSSEPPWAGLQRWRAGVLGKQESPFSAIQTSGRDLDFDHPLFGSRTQAVIFTGRQAASRLEKRAPKNVEIVSLESPGIRSVMHCLRQGFGSQTILVEAGPSTSSQLYHDPPEVDELMLSVYCQPNLAAPVRGGPFLSWKDLRRIFPRISKGYSVQEESGTWQFHRLTRTGSPFGALS